jgi:acyl-CoA thioesterase
VDARTWLGLEPTHDPMRWVLPVAPGICTGARFLFGGCGLGAAIEALEAVTGRPLIWATAQYLSYAKPPEVLDIDVTVAVAGRQVTQARAVGHVGDREILTVNAALGQRSLPDEGQWAQRPEVPEPEACAPRQGRFGGTEVRAVRAPRDAGAGASSPGVDGCGAQPHADAESTTDRLEVSTTDRLDLSIMDRLDLRLASARPLDELPGEGMPHGRSALWARLPEVLEVSPASLAILGDYVPFGIGQALGARAGGNSLDNTLRVVRVVPTEWLLLDIRVHAVANGFGHGVVHLWAEDGTLAATASQSTIVRHWRD